MLTGYLVYCLVYLLYYRKKKQIMKLFCLMKYFADSCSDSFSSKFAMS